MSYKKFIAAVTLFISLVISIQISYACHGIYNGDLSRRSFSEDGSRISTAYFTDFHRFLCLSNSP